MLKALESVLDGGRGRGTGEANTAVVPQAPPGTTAKPTSSSWPCRGSSNRARTLPLSGRQGAWGGAVEG